ncbi:MAG TPA: hypothetical protein VFF40_11035 [Acidimicrobiia bacterium]|nr:hypothetical protein [Acidimicrobiia bacterium]
MKISDLLGDAPDAADAPDSDLPPSDPTNSPTPDDETSPTAARAQLAEMVADMARPTGAAGEIGSATPSDPALAPRDDGGIGDLAALMGTQGTIAEAEGGDSPGVLEPALDDLLPAVRKRTGSRGASRSGSRRRGR